MIISGRQATPSATKNRRPHDDTDKQMEFRVPSIIAVGPGSSLELSRYARQSGFSRPIVVTDSHLMEIGLTTSLIHGLEESGLHPVIFHDVQEDPTVKQVNDGVAVAREHESDGVIAIGGGSPMDVGKAIGAMLGNDASITEYAGYDQIPNTGVPVIAVPTTAGSGSEATRAVVLTDSDQHVKFPVYDDRLLPTVAVVDPTLSLGMPRDLTANVGIDALSHAVEAYVSRIGTPLSDMYALEAIRLISSSIEQVCAEPLNGPARWAMMYGATLAGAAFSNSSIALIHGMSRPLGAKFHVTHGAANAAVMPAVVDFSMTVDSIPRYGAIARQMRLVADDVPDESAAAVLPSALTELNQRLGIRLLRDFVANRDTFEEALPVMAQEALDSGSPQYNPRIPGAADIIDIYRKAY